jgi:hypothetical protein
MNGPDLFPKGDPMEVKAPEKLGTPEFEASLARLKETTARKQLEAKAKATRTRVLRPGANPPAVDGKMAAAGKDDDGDELVSDGKGGWVMKKFLDL